MSQPRPNGGSPSSGKAPERTAASTGLRPVARTWTSTSVASGVGFGRSATVRTSGPPNVDWVMTRMAVVPLGRFWTGRAESRQNGVLAGRRYLLVPRSPAAAAERAMPTMSAEQRRQAEKVAYNAMNADCPTRQLVDVLSDKWVTLVFCALLPGPQRHSQIARQIAGVSQKMLTQTLRGLERDGFVSRTVTPSVPVRVDYELTDLGRSLVPVLEGLRIWSETNIEHVLGARDEYDAVHAR